LDEKYISFRAEEYSYSGGAHGYNETTIGTINRKTGKRMCLADFVSSDKLSKLNKVLRAKVVQKIGGEENLLGEVKVIENFCVVKDGLKFVYNPYEVASYSMGAIEVVVPFEELK
jgi:stalled ribosome rescue protein Dom34